MKFDPVGYRYINVELEAGGRYDSFSAKVPWPLEITPHCVQGAAQLAAVYLLNSQGSLRQVARDGKTIALPNFRVWVSEEPSFGEATRTRPSSLVPYPLFESSERVVFNRADLSKALTAGVSMGINPRNEPDTIRADFGSGPVNCRAVSLDREARVLVVEELLLQRQQRVDLRNVAQEPLRSMLALSDVHNFHFALQRVVNALDNPAASAAG